MYRLLPRLAVRPRILAAPRPLLPTCQFLFHTSAPSSATTLPILAHGPPPKPPLPAGEITDLRRRQKQEQLDRDDGMISSGRPFWKEAYVVEMDGGLAINLDTRTLRTPNRNLILIPRSKAHLAYGIALEWSFVRSARDVETSYLIPLTGLVSRAIDMAASEATDAPEAPPTVARRADIVENLMRYFDTDTLLCYAPSQPAEEGRKTLREMQEEAARPILAFMCTRVWPGVVIEPVDGDEGLIAVKGQPEKTKRVVQGWVESLTPLDLIGLERAVLATKSLVIAARFLAEWSEEVGVTGGVERAFGTHAAAEAASVEVRFQTGRWGEVEDTHDVEKEDLLRQLGAARLLVGGLKNFKL